MLTELSTRLPFATKIADSMPNQLVSFRGMDQEQGSWQYCIDFNRRQMPSLTPSDYHHFIDDQSPDRFHFVRSWKAFHKLQRYTDGEAFFLCYPAALQFGIFAKTGIYDDVLYPSWKKSYLNDQRITESGGESDNQLYESSKFNDRVRKKYRIIDKTVADARELIKLFGMEKSEDLHVVQVSCNYPMFGNKRFGHFVSVVNIEDESTATIAGSLSPFGIYETPFAKVKLIELAAFAEMSNRLMLKSSNPGIDLQDRTTISGINVMSVSKRQEHRT